MLPSASALALLGHDCAHGVDLESCELWYEHNMVVSDAMHTTRMAGRDGARGSEMGRRRRGSAAALLAGVTPHYPGTGRPSETLSRVSGRVTVLPTGYICVRMCSYRVRASGVSPQNSPHPIARGCEGPYFVFCVDSGVWSGHTRA